MTDLLTMALNALLISGGSAVLMALVILLMLSGGQIKVALRVIATQAIILFFVFLLGGAQVERFYVIALACSAIVMVLIMLLILPKEQIKLALRVVATYTLMLAFVFLFGGGVQIPKVEALNQQSNSQPLIGEVVEETSYVANNEDNQLSETVDQPERQNLSFDIGSKSPDGRFTDGVQYFNYIIQPGDTIYSIRHEYGLSESEILTRNNLTLRDIIFPGDTLKITI